MHRSRVFIVDDDPSIRKSLGRVVSAAGHEVTLFESGTEFLESWNPHGPACVVLDVRLPGVDGMELHRRIREGDGAVAVVFLTGYGEVSSGVEAIKSGAVDYLEKPVDRDTLLEAIETGLAKARRTHEDAREVRSLRRRYASLTPREREVMQLVIAGRLNKQIADELGISEKTVKVHRGRAMKKMEARRVAHLVAFANRLGLDEDPDLNHRASRAR